MLRNADHQADDLLFEWSIEIEVHKVDRELRGHNCVRFLDLLVINVKYELEERTDGIHHVRFDRVYDFLVFVFAKANGLAEHLEDSVCKALYKDEILVSPVHESLGAEIRQYLG